MHKFYLYVDTDNKKLCIYTSRKDLKQKDYSKEQFYTKGKYKDAYFMSLLKSEYI